MNTNEHKNSGSATQSDERVREKFSEWQDILVGGDIHTVRSQIYEMTEDAAFFQCINESRRYAPKDEKGNDKRNEMLHSFINQCFFKTQLLSIRRLVDKDRNRVRKNKPYTVYSLYNLIEDMKKNGALFTRENILAVHDLPYDYEKAMECLRQNTPKIREGKAQVQVWSGGDLDGIDFSEDIHRRIDSLTGIAADKRSRDDSLLGDILKQLGDKLARVEELCKYVDKYIAHAATPADRRAISDEIDGALGKVLDAHKVICETASFIGNSLLFCGFGDVLSTSQYGHRDQCDLFEYLDEPIASQETMEKLKEFWGEYRRKTQQWIQCKI